LDDISDEQLGDVLFDEIVAARQGTAVTHHEYHEVWSLD
jgi:hypothetical protein